MMGSGAGQPASAGGPARHVPVLVRQAVDLLAVRGDGLYLDATFGAGGYTSAILATPGARVIALDRDPSAIARGANLVAASGGRLTLVEARFSDLAEVVRELGLGPVDGVVFDLGVSSMQLDEAERGFSFRHDGPLDMRMSHRGPSAADVVALATERDLAAIFALLGEERFARPIARAIIKARDAAPILTTRALSDLISRVVPARPGEIHPATRAFQGLRIYVNEELNEIADGLAAAERVLKPGGRLSVVSFHSLEDRIVKVFLAERAKAPATSRHAPQAAPFAPSFAALTRKPVAPSADEISANPRARSAKLRGAQRTDAPPLAGQVEDLLPRLPSLTELMRGRSR